MPKPRSAEERPGRSRSVDRRSAGPGPRYRPPGRHCQRLTAPRMSLRIVKAGRVTPVTRRYPFGHVAATGCRCVAARALTLDSIAADGLIVRETRLRESRMVVAQAATGRAHLRRGRRDRDRDPPGRLEERRQEREAVAGGVLRRGADGLDGSAASNEIAVPCGNGDSLSACGVWRFQGVPPRARRVPRRMQATIRGDWYERHRPRGRTAHPGDPAEPAFARPRECPKDTARSPGRR